MRTTARARRCEGARKLGRAVRSSLVFGLAMTAIAGIAEAQAPAAPAIYSVTYAEVMPSSQAEGVALLKRYRDATRKEDGNLRTEVVSRVGQHHQFVILEVWKDQKAHEAHGKSQNTAQTRTSLAAIRNAPLDERVHVGVSVGPLQPGPGGEAVYVVTHVDVIPPRKDDGLAAIKELGDASRGGAGNARFEVVQQTNRPNHFTVVEVWRDGMAVATHSMAEATRRFRDKLGPMSGSLYDERMYRLVD